jgi:hypothetical protein
MQMIMGIGQQKDVLALHQQKKMLWICCSQDVLSMLSKRK